MATPILINTTFNKSLLTGAQITIPQTEAMERFQEQFSELSQDNARAGYYNMGSETVRLGGSNGENQYITGQAGNDTIRTFSVITSNGVLVEVSGDDTVYGGSGNDWISAGPGNDTLFGGSGNDSLSGGLDNDTLNGGSGADSLYGGEGLDILNGGTGDDVLIGGFGSDVLFGGADNDLLYGDTTYTSFENRGNDTLDGGFGNDLLYGGIGADRLTGGAGDDRFQFTLATDLSQGHTDVITDFQHWDGAHGDRIDLRQIDPNASQAGDQSFFFTEGPSTVRGALWLGDVVNGQQKVFMNSDGADPFINGPIELIVQFNDPTMTTLQASDFIF
jgi:Ca2+-binding RTX toxin-like protein